MVERVYTFESGCIGVRARGVATGVDIGIYTPQNQQK